MFSEGIVEVSTRPFGFCRTYRTPNLESNKDRPAAILVAPVSKVAPVSSPVSPHLPMWPPTRRVWPPSRSVLRGRGVGEEGCPSGGAAAQVCREAGARVDVSVRDVDLATYGLTLWRGFNWQWTLQWCPPAEGRVTQA